VLNRALYIDRAESIECRFATFEEETVTERGTSDDGNDRCG
jgi:hypothetical protein